MSGFQKSTEDYDKHLAELRDALFLSSRLFDEGHSSEAKRLAVAIRVLVHDTASSVSLLKHLGRKESLRYWASPKPMDPSNLLSQACLTTMVAGPTPTYRAILGEHPPGSLWRRADFTSWWDEDVIRDKNHQMFSRKYLVLNMANKDGGAHVDATLNAKYADLSRRNSIAWVLNVGDTEKSAACGVESATIRQLAHELQRTLDEQVGGGAGQYIDYIPLSNGESD